MDIANKRGNDVDLKNNGSPFYDALAGDGFMGKAMGDYKPKATVAKLITQDARAGVLTGISEKVRGQNFGSW